MHYLDYNEKRSHGTADFPLAFYHIEAGHPRYEMPFHWHREMEIIRIVKGNLALFLNNEKIEAAAGDVVFVNPGVMHAGIPSDCIYECVVFDPSILQMHTDICRKYIKLLTGSQTRIKNFFPASAKAVCEAAADLFKNAKKQEPGSELLTLGALFMLFGIIYSNHDYQQDANSQTPDTDKIQLLKPVLEYIDHSYMHPITLEELARLSGLSPRYFCRFFAAFIHRTPMDYLNYYRIEQACSLLISSQSSVTEAAYRCGFNDSSYFVKIFKKYKGITPLQYQKQMGK